MLFRSRQSCGPRRYSALFHFPNRGPLEAGAVVMTDLFQADTHFHGWFNGAASLAVCAVLLPLVLELANRWRLYDLPGTLKPHLVPTPRLGGLAMGCALIVGMSIGGTGLFSPALNVFVALLIVWLTGLVDDLRGLSPGIRLIAQTQIGRAHV